MTLTTRTITRIEEKAGACQPRLTFDAADVDHLVRRFTLAELRHEADAAEVRDSVAEAWRGTEYQSQEDLFAWADYANCCREAIERIQHSRPKPQPAHGRIDTEAIKAKNDIVAVIEQYTRLRKAGKNFTGRCPIHRDQNPSMTVYPDSQTWHCYGCNRGGDVFAFIQAVENTDFRGAAAILGGK